MNADPKRWLDPDGDGPTDLVELLRHAEPPEHLPPPALDALVSRTAARLSTPATGPLLLKLSLGLVAVVAALAALLSTGDDRSPPPVSSPTPSRPVETVDGTSTSRSLSPDDPLPSAASVASAPTAEPPTGEPATVEPATVEPRRARALLDEADTLAAEAASLERVRAAIDAGTPDLAVRRVRAHRRAFPRGQLIAERDRLEIEALVRAGRIDEAERRGAAFLRDHGSSVYAPRVRALLEDRDR